MRIDTDKTLVQYWCAQALFWLKKIPKVLVP